MDMQETILFPKEKSNTSNRAKYIKYSSSRRKRKEQEAKKRADLNALAERLNKLTVKFTLKAGEDDKLFGSVTSQMIVDAVNVKGYELKKKKLNY